MNKLILTGRLTKDPELKYTSVNTTPFCSFTLAVDRRVKAGEEKQADFINCTAWGKTAESIAKYLSKGRKIVIFGRIQTRTWDDNDGKKHYATDVVADEFEFADSKPAGDNAGSGSPAPGTPSQHSGGGGFYPEDDDLPF